MNSNSRQKRIEALGKRFSEDALAPKQQRVSVNNNRKRHSVYIDADLMKRIDEIFKGVQHEVYPAEVTKSLFLEKLLENGLENLEAVKAAMVAS
jgi:hypothetical protein